jgi:hypothetical protein
MSDRDFASEMRSVIDSATDNAVSLHGGYTPRKLASDIVHQLKMTDPELLDGWLSDQAEQILWRTINDIDRSSRGHLRATATRRAFALAAGAYAEGDTEALKEYLSLRFTVEDGTRRPLRNLRQADLLFVSASYASQAKRSTFMATVMAKLAERVGDGKVEDVYTDAELEKIFGSFAEENG